MVVQASVGAKGHATQFTVVGEHVWEVFCFTVVPNVGGGPIGELLTDATEVGARRISVDIHLQVLR